MAFRRPLALLFAYFAGLFRHFLESENLFSVLLARFGVRYLSLLHQIHQTRKEMQFITASGKFDSEAAAIADVQANQMPGLETINGKCPVIVKTRLSKTRISYGVQFWTPAEIERGWSDNGDGTTAFKA